MSVLVLLLLAAMALVPAIEKVAEETRQGFVEVYGKLPLSFEANQGQTDKQVKFLLRGSGYTLFLTPDEAVLSLRRSTSEEGDPTAYDVMRLQLIGANPDPLVAGVDERLGKSSYFIGNDPNTWHTNISHYSKIHYQQVYPGVDLIYTKATGIQVSHSDHAAFCSVFSFKSM